MGGISHVNLVAITRAVLKIQAVQFIFCHIVKNGYIAIFQNVRKYELNCLYFEYSLVYCHQIHGADACYHVSLV